MMLSYANISAADVEIQIESGWRKQKKSTATDPKNRWELSKISSGAKRKWVAIRH